MPVLHEFEEEEVANVIELLGGSTIFDHVFSNPLDAHERIIQGFPGVALTALFSNLEVITKYGALEKVLGVSARTFLRKQKNVFNAVEPTSSILSPELSGRLWKFAEVLAKATAIFGTQKEAEQWLESPAIGLEQRRPIDLLSSPTGTELVEEYLERIEFGVYA